MMPANGRVTRDFITQRSTLPYCCKVKDRQIDAFHCAAARVHARCRTPSFVPIGDPRAWRATRGRARGANRQ
ncbi:hypothetical protein E2R23_24255 [Burkholderia pseudomallei]|nr:hypothetical protein [Burkholderia pseudomallei]NRE30540.1 hypothetical protein [Burkholderia pseudomallei]QBL80775.1 hypothetical protein EYA82_24060 [Burkholderia pseudomallei]QBP57933.1 hypothetical protein E2R23_24255 [Burkholderia pseudomallei]